MKKIVSLYLALLFACFVLGVVIALAVHYSLWFLFLLMFPISLGWLPISMIIDEIPGNLVRVFVVTLLLFISLIIALIFGALYVNGNSFWGFVYVVSSFTSLLQTILVLMRLRTEFETAGITIKPVLVEIPVFVLCMGLFG